MTSDLNLGSIDRSDGRTTLKFQRSLEHAPEKVWRTLTESEHMRWWMPADMIGERAAGATVAMTFWPDLVEKMGMDPDAGTATISHWVPHERFEFVWHGIPIRFELAATLNGCTLDLTVDLETDDTDAIVDNACGYHQWVEHLNTLLDHGTSPSIAHAEPHSVEDEYRRLANKR